MEKKQGGFMRKNIVVSNLVSTRRGGSSAARAVGVTKGGQSYRSQAGA